MKKSMKRWLSGLLAMVMVFTGIGVNTKKASAAESMMQNYVYDGYEVTFEVTSVWDGAFNADVKIANTGDTTICDWVLSFDFDHAIQNIWNATVLEHTDNTYVIKNNDWNANIKPGEGIGFGMMIQYDGDITFPKNFSFMMEEDLVTEQSYSAEFTLYSDWGTGCNGAIILRNLTDENIENWQLSFDYDREIVNISSAVIVSHEQGHYVIQNAEYNTVIAGNSSVQIGIVAGEGVAEERPENFSMRQTVVGDKFINIEGGSTDTPKEGELELSDEEKKAIIAGRLKGVKYTEPEEAHIKYDEATGIYYVDNQLLIITAEDVALEEVETFASEMEATVVGYIVLTGDYQLEFPEARTLEELNALVEKIARSDLVEEAMLHELFEISICAIPNDPAWYDKDVEVEEWEGEWDASFPAGNNWGLEAINAMDAWEYEGEVVNVGIIDTVFDEKHLDLDFEETWLNIPNVDEKYQAAKTGEDIQRYAHGTHVAGIIAAKYNNNIGITGVANNVNIYGVATHVARGVDGVNFVSFIRNKYALAILLLNDCRVINVSLGTSRGDIDFEAKVYEEFLYKFLQLGYDFVIVQAAGNEAEDASKSGLFANITRPEVRNRIIVVGAIELNSPFNLVIDNYLKLLFNDRCKILCGYTYWSMSNHGERVDVCAPGVKIYSTLPGNEYSNIFKDSEDENKRLYWTGSSMATPHVSGVAAKCYSANSKLTGIQVKEIICNTATKMVNRESDNTKYPLVNAKAAVEAAMKTEGDMINVKPKVVGSLVGRVYEYSSFQMNIPSNDYITAQNVCVYVYETEKGSGKLLNCVDVINLNKEGEFSFILPEGYYCIIVSSPDYLPVLYTNVFIRADEVSAVNILAYLVDIEGDEVNTVIGTVYDAVTGESISDVNIDVVIGFVDVTEEVLNNMKNAGDSEADSEGGTYSIIKRSVTDSQGRYSFELPVGYYTLILKKDGYIVGSAQVLSIADHKGNKGVKQQNTVMTPVLKSGEYRIVLTWGQRPRDLDSHLVGYHNGTQKFHIYYSNKIYTENGEIIAQLDRDDVTSYGPETITLTLHADEKDEYLYYVRDYTNGGDSSSLEMSFSDAVVTVYYCDKIVETFAITPSQYGTVWRVFEINNGKVNGINEVN